MNSDNLLQALNETAQQYGLCDDQHLSIERSVARIIIKPNGEYVESELIETQKKMPRRVASSQDQSTSRFLIEKPTRVLGVESDGHHEAFVEQIRQAASDTGDPGLLAVLEFFKKYDKNQIARDLKKVLGLKNEHAQTTFSIRDGKGNACVFSPAVNKWWKKEYSRQVRDRFRDCKESICQITGKKDLIPNRPPITKGAWGQLFSANGTAFEMSGYREMESSHMGIEAWTNVGMAFEGLVGNKLVYNDKPERTSYSIGAKKAILSWFLKPSTVLEQDAEAVKTMIIGSKDPWDEVRPADGGPSETEDSHLSYIDWVAAQYKGKQSVLRPSESKDNEFCTLLVEDNQGRVVLQEAAFLTLDQLRESIIAWSQDTQIDRWVFDKVKKKWVDLTTRKQLSVLRAMHLLVSPDVKKIPSHITRCVHKAFFRNKSLGGFGLVNLNKQFKSAMFKKTAATDILALMRMILIREGIDMPVKWDMKKAESSSFYSMGGLLFLVAFTQDYKNKGRESFIPMKYLSMCCTNPQNVSFPLLRSFTIYQNRLRRDNLFMANLIARIHGTLMANIGDWPKSLTNAQRSELILGFSLLREVAQREKLRDVFPELVSSKKEKNNGN